MNVDQTLKEMGLVLPQPSTPIANFVMSVGAGKLLFISGHGPVQDGTTKTSGRVGGDLSMEEGRQAAENVALNCLATIKAAIGDWHRVRRFVKVFGMVNCTEDFHDQPQVINGCSDLLVRLFGDSGKHARSAIGVQSLPNNIPVEIEMIVELD